MIEGDCIDANGGNHCNVNVRTLLKGNEMRNSQKSVRSEPLLCEHSNCTGVGNELCVRLIVPMNSLELTWCWIGIAIGLSIGVVGVPFANFGKLFFGALIEWIISKFQWSSRMIHLSGWLGREWDEKISVRPDFEAVLWLHDLKMGIRIGNGMTFILGAWFRGRFVAARSYFRLRFQPIVINKHYRGKWRFTGDSFIKNENKKKSMEFKP